MIIPVCEEDAQYLDRTVASIKENAGGPIEIIAVHDYPERRGIRWILNDAAKRAKGKYLVKFDSHCALTQDWDLKMKESCTEKRIVVSRLKFLDVETWRPYGRLFSFVTLDVNLKNQYLKRWQEKDYKLEEPVVSFLGCSWMIRRKYYLDLHGCDESYGVWGLLGPEWALKVWFTGGEVMLRADVTCAHLFRKRTPFTVEMTKQRLTLRDLCKRWILGEDERCVRTAQSLVTQFAFSNGWDMPIFGLGGEGFTMSENCWNFLKDFIKKNDIGDILEFGAGKSTLLLDELGCRVTSYETIAGYKAVIRTLLNDTSEIYLWDGRDAKIEGQFDLVFIDGPKGGENRSDAYRLAAENIDTKYIACHDTHRAAERGWIGIYFRGFELLETKDNDRIRIFRKPGSSEAIKEVA